MAAELYKVCKYEKIKWCEYAILREFEVFEDCENCIAMEQSGYISEWQNLFLTLTSLYKKLRNFFSSAVFLQAFQDWTHD